MAEPVFVFGSNRAGRHGKGAALWALRNAGAILGQGEGMQGNSYGIPTKGHHMEVLGLDQISSHVMKFLRFANDHRELTFRLTAIGCGLAGYSPAQIAPMFNAAPENIIIPDLFKPFIKKG